MNEIIPFRFEDTSVRVLDIDGEPWFVLADVTSVLEHSNSRMVAQRLDDDVRTTYPIQDSMGREQMTYIISEPGLYEVIATSRSVSAKPFKKWVFGEVLPQLRKTGSYGQVQQLTGPELMAAALIEADSVIKSQTLQIEAADKYISELTPKAEYVDLYVTDQDLRTLREVAKNLGAQETEVRTALLERRWIYCDVTRSTCRARGKHAHSHISASDGASSPKHDAGCSSAVKDQRPPQFCRRSAPLPGNKIGSPAARYAATMPSLTASTPRPAEPILIDERWGARHHPDGGSYGQSFRQSPGAVQRSDLPVLRDALRS